MTAAACVALSFVLFATDQSEEGSATQVSALGDNHRVESQADIDRPAPDEATERLREARHSGVRELIDDGNDALVAPFADIADSSNVWVERLVSGGLAALLFGLGGTIAANFVPKRPRKSHDWREATG